jgi:hypothetical protein
VISQSGKIPAIKHFAPITPELVIFQYYRHFFLTPLNQLTSMQVNVTFCQKCVADTHTTISSTFCFEEWKWDKNCLKVVYFAS